MVSRSLSSETRYGYDGLRRRTAARTEGRMAAGEDLRAGAERVQVLAVSLG